MNNKLIPNTSFMPSNSITPMNTFLDTSKSSLDEVFNHYARKDVNFIVFNADQHMEQERKVIKSRYQNLSLESKLIMASQTLDMQQKQLIKRAISIFYASFIDVQSEFGFDIVKQAVSCSKKPITLSGSGLISLIESICNVYDQYASVGSHLKHLNIKSDVANEIKSLMKYFMTRDLEEFDHISKTELCFTKDKIKIVKSPTLSKHHDKTIFLSVICSIIELFSQRKVQRTVLILNASTVEILCAKNIIKPVRELIMKLNFMGHTFCVLNHRDCNQIFAFPLNEICTRPQIYGSLVEQKNHEIMIAS